MAIIPVRMTDDLNKQTKERAGLMGVSANRYMRLCLISPMSAVIGLEIETEEKNRKYKESLESQRGE